MKKQKTRHPKMTCSRQSSQEEEVLKAWHYGDRTIWQIIKITGLPLEIVRRYIPLDENG